MYMAEMQQKQMLMWAQQQQQQLMQQPGVPQQAQRIAKYIFEMVCTCLYSVVLRDQGGVPRIQLRNKLILILSSWQEETTI